MEEFWISILVLFFASNSLDKAESVKLEETPLKTFDEIFGEGWWDKSDAEDLKMPAPTNFGQNVHHQIDRQNTQIGQIEPNSTDQHGHTSNEKRKIVAKFHEIKDEFKKIGKYSAKKWNQIEARIAKHLKVSRKQIYEWKKELALSRRNPKNERKNLVEKFDQMKAELKRAGFKNSYNYEIDKTVAKELGLSFMTIYNWKRKLGQTTANKYANDKQKELLMKRYYEIKGNNPKSRDVDIIKILNIAIDTLVRWKRQFKRQQLQPNSVDGHSVENNDGSNVQKIGNSNSGSRMNGECC